jgi:hypothetical protein
MSPVSGRQLSLCKGLANQGLERRPRGKPPLRRSVLAAAESPGENHP